MLVLSIESGHSHVHLPPVFLPLPASSCPRPCRRYGEQDWGDPHWDASDAGGALEQCHEEFDGLFDTARLEDWSVDAVGIYWEYEDQEVGEHAARTQDHGGGGAGGDTRHEISPHAHARMNT